MTVGLEQTAYTVTEIGGYQLACFKVLSGDVAGRELSFDYSTSSGTASKTFVPYLYDSYCMDFVSSHK